MSQATWLPNLVGGTSIWKLAVDLNEAKFFDGRLLVPETEGSESLPVTVRWDLTGLIPLTEARQKHPEETAAAIKDFQSALERVAKVFATPNSGFDKYKDAFTVPSLDADQGANYFYSPAQRKLFVTNWGASPRSMGGKAEYVFGYEDWGKHWQEGTAPAAAGAAVAAAGGLGAAAVAASAANPSDDKNEQKKPEKKKDSKARPWWMWPLFGLIAIALVLLALFLLKACEEQKVITGADASDAPTEAANANANADSAAATTSEAGADGSVAADGGDAKGDASAAADAAGADAASADGGDAGAGKDGGLDGGLAMDEDDDDVPEGSSGGGGSSGGAGSSGAPAVVKIGPGGGQKTSVHRKHYSDGAVHWRISAGAQKLSRTEEQGRRFDVWLTPGQTFEGVRVEWQDKAGKWHVH